MNKTAVAQQAKTSSFLSPAQGIIRRKCACGNQIVAGGECEECKKKKNSLQRKLTVGASNDPLEREADRIADQVMATPANSPVSSPPLRIQRYAEPTAEGMDTAPASVDRVLASSGRPLEPALRQDMEQRFGHDFSRVRVHADGAEAAGARAVRACAYTVGRDIVFGSAQYAPATMEGKRLLAHELTHVVQSAGSIGRTVNSTFPGLLMRQPEENDKTEQPPEKGQTDKPARKATAVDDPCTATDPQLPVYKEAEQKQRDDILQDMLRGLTATEKKDLCTRFRRALGAFSTSQMLTMKTAGVRFWRPGEFPPPFKDEYAPRKAKRNEMARYQYEYRVIQWRSQAGVDEIRHELAHAWDHVRGGKVPKLDAYRGDKLKKAVLTPATFSSESAEKRLTVEETVGGKKQKVGLSIKDVYDRFMKRPAQTYWSFANTKTDPEHVTSNVREFYAEGYSVFHGENEDAQAQLICDAPELYQLLEREANEEKLAVPDRAKLAENNKTNNRKCV